LEKLSEKQAITEAIATNTKKNFLININNFSDEKEKMKFYKKK
jgi:hypothetical protein